MFKLKTCSFEMHRLLGGLFMMAALSLLVACGKESAAPAPTGAAPAAADPFLVRIKPEMANHFKLGEVQFRKARDPHRRWRDWAYH